MQSFEKALHQPMPFTTGGQTITDRLTAAKHSLAGSMLGKAICKATTEEPIGPKKKHLDYLIHCTHEPNVSIPQMANMLIERTQNVNWAVVFKSLLTMHNVMCYGNERFTQYLASCNSSLNLASYLDKSTVQGYDMSTHVRRYAKYISEKIYTYRLCAFDFCKVKRGREDGLLRTMHAEKLLKSLPVLQGQIDALLEFQVNSNELTNGVINSCFILLFRDLIRLFACYNDGIINLLEKYFEMNKKQCKEALDLYKSFLQRMDKVAEFLKVAETVGIDRGEIPDLARAPNSLLEALEQHLNALEGGKPGSRVTSPITSSAAQSMVQQMQGMDVSSVNEAEKQKYILEEQHRLQMLKNNIAAREQQTSNGANPFLSNGTSINNAGPDLFSFDGPTPMSNMAPPPVSNGRSSAVDDLLSLNPFSPNIQGASVPSPQQGSPFSVSQPGAPFASPQPYSAPAIGYGGNTSNNAFAPDFSKAFGNQSESGYEEAAVNTNPFNPFLSETSNNPPPSQQTWTQPKPTWTPFSMQDQHSAAAEIAMKQESSDEDIPLNPFAAFAKNAAELSAKEGPDHSHLGVGPPVLPSPSPEPSPMTTPFQGDPFHGHTASPFHTPASASPIPGQSAPMPVQQTLNIYHQTPYSGMDASYTSSPALPRHMIGQQPQAMASSYTGETAMGNMGFGGMGGPVARPPSAPATELSGLDPFGDLLTPQTSNRPSNNPPMSGPGKAKVLTGDLNSSLANLAQNLSISKANDPNKPVNWTAGMKSPAPGQVGAAPGAVPGTGWNPMAQPGYGMPYGQGGVPAWQQGGMSQMMPPQGYPQQVSLQNMMMGSMPQQFSHQPQQQAPPPAAQDPFGF